MRVGILVVMDERGVASTTRLTTEGLHEVEQAAEGAAEGADRMGREARGAAEGADRMGREARGAARGADRMDAAVRRSERGLRGWIRRLRESHPAAVRLGSYLLAGGGLVGGLYAVGRAAAAAGRAVVGAGLRLQGYRSRMLAAVQDHRLAAREIGWVRAEAERLGLDFDLLAEAYGGLAAATRGTAVDLDLTREVFSAVAEAARAMHLDVQDVHGTMRALIQMASRGRISLEELTGQLGERLPGALQATAAAWRSADGSIGIGTDELIRMVETGDVMVDDLFPALAAGLRELSAGSLAVAASGAEAAFARLEDAVDRLSEAVAESGVLDWLAAMAEGAADVVDAISGRGVQAGLDELRAERDALVERIAAVARAEVRAGRTERRAARHGSELTGLYDEFAGVTERIRRMEDELPERIAAAIARLEREAEAADAAADGRRGRNRVRRPSAAARRLVELREIQAEQLAAPPPAPPEAPPPVRTDAAAAAAVRDALREAEAADLSGWRRALRDAREEAVGLLDALDPAAEDWEEQAALAERVFALRRARALELRDEEEAAAAEAAQAKLDAERALAEERARLAGLRGAELARLDDRIAAVAASTDLSADALRRESDWLRVSTQARHDYSDALADGLVTEEDLSAVVERRLELMELLARRERRSALWEELTGGAGRRRLEDLESLRGRDDVDPRRLEIEISRQEIASRLEGPALDWADAAQRALVRTRLEAERSAERMEEVLAGAFAGAGDALADFARTGRLEIGRLVDGIIAELARLAIQRAIVAPIASALGSALGWGAPAPAAAPHVGGSSHGSYTGHYVAHGGWSVGDPTGARRSGVDPLLFAAAPRLHRGLAADEFPAILQTGERVLSRREVAEGRAPIEVEVQVINRGTPQRAAERSARWDGRRAVVEVVVDDLARRGPIARALDGSGRLG